MKVVEVVEDEMHGVGAVQVLGGRKTEVWR